MKTILKTTLLFLIFTSSITLSSYKFPDNFLFGVASSAYQIEGGHDANGKGESIWDYHLRINPALVTDLSNGNVACNSYVNYQEDIKLLDELGVDFYRFSISWSRILPNGLSSNINPDGVRFYNGLIDGLIAKNIMPMVTMYHWDLPKKLQDVGGWTNSIVVDYFADYARILFENFGDRVNYWITFNVAFMGYGDAEWPPLINHTGIGEYLYFKNILLAHAEAYLLYKNEFKKQQNGQIGITSDGRWYEPASSSQLDLEATERTRQFFYGIITNPLLGNGDFPEVVKKRVGFLSENEGFARTRLPQFSQEEKQLLSGSLDFYGVNVYTTFLIRHIEDNFYTEPSFIKDLGVKFEQDAQWKKSNSPWLTVVPWGLRKTLQWFKSNYGDFPIFITENGYSDKGELADTDRIQYFELYLHALLKAIHEDEINVKGYAAWSLTDNFEWLAGYTEKFGLYHVNFEDPLRERSPKSSAKWYKNLLQSRQLHNKTLMVKTEL